MFTSASTAGTFILPNNTLHILTLFLVDNQMGGFCVTWMARWIPSHLVNLFTYHVSKLRTICSPGIVLSIFKSHWKLSSHYKSLCCMLLVLDDMKVVYLCISLFHLDSNNESNGKNNNRYRKGMLSFCTVSQCFQRWVSPHHMYMEYWDYSMLSCTGLFSFIQAFTNVDKCAQHWFIYNM